MKRFFKERVLPLIIILVIGVGVILLAVFLSGLALARAEAGDERLLYVCVGIVLFGLFFPRFYRVPKAVYGFIRSLWYDLTNVDR